MSRTESGKRAAKASGKGNDELWAQRMKLLADKNRWAILRHLTFEGESSVSQLCEETKIPQSLMSHHLRILREAQLIHASKQGRLVLYDVSPSIRVDKKIRQIDLGCCKLIFEKTL